MPRIPVPRAVLAAAAALACGCGTDPRRGATPEPAPPPERRAAADEPAPLPEPRAAVDEPLPELPATGPRGPSRAGPQVAVLRRTQADVEPQAAPAAPPGVGVTSIDVALAGGDAGSALQMFVVDRGRLRILERAGAVFEEVGPQRLPALERVERAVVAKLRPDSGFVLAITDGRLAVLERDPQGVYVDRSPEVLPLDPPTDVTWVATADIDSDGDLDVIVAAGGSVRLLRNEGPDRLVDRTREVMPAASPRCVRVFPYDIGEDGVLDLVTVDPDVHILVNDRRGRFVDESPVRLPAGPRNARTVLAWDADDDSDVDVLLLRGAEPDALWLSDGRGHLVPAPDGFMRSVRALEGVRIDVDRDATPDMATVGADGLVLRAVEDGRRIRDDSWRLPPDLPDRLTEVRAFDVDGLNGLDLVLGGPSGLTILLADGRGRYVDSTALLLPEWD